MQAKGVTVKALEEPIPFFIDKLCTPVQLLMRRRSAIARLQTIFQQADKALVLDSGLRQVSMSVHPIELNMRIQCSAWMQRLWTFQEEEAARNQLKDIAVEASALKAQIDENRLEYTFGGAFDFTSIADINWGESSRVLRKYGEAFPYCMALACGTLEWRSVSKAEDESINDSPTRHSSPSGDRGKRITDEKIPSHLSASTLEYHFHDGSGIGHSRLSMGSTTHRLSCNSLQERDLLG